MSTTEAFIVRVNKIGGRRSSDLLRDLAIGRQHNQFGVPALTEIPLKHSTFVLSPNPLCSAVGNRGSAIVCKMLYGRRRLAGLGKSGGAVRRGSRRLLTMPQTEPGAICPRRRPPNADAD